MTRSIYNACIIIINREEINMLCDTTNIIIKLNNNNNNNTSSSRNMLLYYCLDQLGELMAVFIYNYYYINISQ